MIEAARRHGAFDPRYPRRHQGAAGARAAPDRIVGPTSTLAWEDKADTATAVEAVVPEAVSL